MRLLQLLNRPRKHTAELMWYKEQTYNKKFYSITSVKYNERFNKIKPYLLNYMQELEDEMKFLDTYFTHNDRYQPKYWWNNISREYRQRWDDDDS